MALAWFVEFIVVVDDRSIALLLLEAGGRMMMRSSSCEMRPANGDEPGGARGNVTATC